VPNNKETALKLTPQVTAFLFKTSTATFFVVTTGWNMVLTAVTLLLMWSSEKRNKYNKKKRING